MTRLFLGMMLGLTWFVVVPIVILALIGFFVGQKYPGKYDRKGGKKENGRKKDNSI